jgi:hypothetical protein
MMVENPRDDSGKSPVMSLVIPVITAVVFFWNSLVTSSSVFNVEVKNLKKCVLIKQNTKTNAVAKKDSADICKPYMR